MSTPDDTPAPEPSRYTGGQIALMLFGILLLLPGFCSLFVILSNISEWNPKEPFFETIVAVWIITFALAALAIALIYMARRESKPR